MQVVDEPQGRNPPALTAGKGLQLPVFPSHVDPAPPPVRWEGVSWASVPFACWASDPESLCWLPPNRVMIAGVSFDSHVKHANRCAQSLWLLLQLRKLPEQFYASWKKEGKATPERWMAQRQDGRLCTLAESESNGVSRLCGPHSLILRADWEQPTSNLCAVPCYN